LEHACRLGYTVRTNEHSAAAAGRAPRYTGEDGNREGENLQRTLLWLIRKALPWAALLAALWLIRETASGLLGKDSMLELWIAWMGSARVTRLSAIVFGLGGVAYGLQQRALRRQLEKALAECLKEGRQP
jgi:hypothetical protein